MTNQITMDKIEKQKIANSLAHVGETANPHDSDSPIIRYANIGYNARYDSVKRCLLLNSEDTDKLHYGWTNDNRSTWKITDRGQKIEVTEVIELDIAKNDKPVDDSKQYVQDWIEILLEEFRYSVENDNNWPTFDDEIRFVGKRMIKLRDLDGRTATFKFELVEK